MSKIYQKQKKNLSFNLIAKIIVKNEKIAHFIGNTIIFESFKVCTLSFFFYQKYTTTYNNVLEMQTRTK